MCDQKGGAGMIQPSRTYDTGHGNSFKVEEWDLPYKVVLKRTKDLASLQIGHEINIKEV